MESIYGIFDGEACSLGGLGKKRRASGNTGEPPAPILGPNPSNRNRTMTRISLVTGASRGLGRNTAVGIARKGGDVVLTYQSREDEAKAVVAEIEALGRKAVALKLDAGSVGGFAAFADRVWAALKETWQRDTFDHLVNNAGHGDVALIAEMTEEQFDKLCNVHFKGVFFLTQKLLPLIATVAVS